MIPSTPILADIGNTTIDLLIDGVRHKHLIRDFNPHTFTQEIWYSNVNHALSSTLSSLSNWHTIADLVDKNRYYPTMGMDRIMVCEAIENGVIVDAGSAITVDRMEEGAYLGGFISLGLQAAQEAYGRLSPALGMSFNFEVDLTIMAKNTPDAITLGFLAPLIALIEGYGQTIYLSGGDAHRFKHFLKDAHVDEMLVFRGMKKLLEKGSLC